MATLRRHNQQTIAWFNDLNKRGLLDLDPPYQRRSVWNQSYKDAFIDTILIQYPSPAIFLYQEISPDGQTQLHVVDGKQRLTAIFEFVAGAFPVAEDAQTTQLRGKYFEQLPADVKTSFWTYEFSVEYLPTNEEGLINGIFERINKNTAKLTRQELRHARFNGLFITAAEQLAEWMLKKLPENFPRFDSQSRKQMKDIELVASLLLLIEEGVSGYSQDGLDQAFSDRDVSWEDAADTEQSFREIIDLIASVVVLPDQSPLFRSRLRNQADFYSFFGAVASFKKSGDPVLQEDGATLAERLSAFVDLVDDDTRRPKHEAASQYLVAARSNSNDLGQRKSRIDIISSVLRGISIGPRSWIDPSGENVRAPSSEIVGFNCASELRIGLATLTRPVPFDGDVLDFVLVAKDEVGDGFQRIRTRLTHSADDNHFPPAVKVGLIGSSAQRDEARFPSVEMVPEFRTCAPLT